MSDNYFWFSSFEEGLEEDVRFWSIGVEGVAFMFSVCYLEIF